MLHARHQLTDLLSAFVPACSQASVCCRCLHAHRTIIADLCPSSSLHVQPGFCLQLFAAVPVAVSPSSLPTVHVAAVSHVVVVTGTSSPQPLPCTSRCLCFGNSEPTSTLEACRCSSSIFSATARHLCKLLSHLPSTSRSFCPAASSIFFNFLSCSFRSLQVIVTAVARPCKLLLLVVIVTVGFVCFFLL